MERLNKILLIILVTLIVMGCDKLGSSSSGSINTGQFVGSDEFIEFGKEVKKLYNPRCLLEIHESKTNSQFGRCQVAHINITDDIVQGAAVLAHEDEHCLQIGRQTYEPFDYVESEKQALIVEAEFLRSHGRHAQAAERENISRDYIREYYGN